MNSNTECNGVNTNEDKHNILDTVILKPSEISSNGREHAKEKNVEVSKIWPQLLAVLSASVLAIGIGALGSWPTPSAPKLLANNDIGFEVSADEVSYVIMLGPLGTLLGSPMSALILDRIGRKFTLVVAASPQIISWLLVATSSNVIMLYVGRFMSGVSSGAVITAAPAYLCEVLEPRIRGAMGLSQSLGVTLGALIIISYASYVPIKMAACIAFTIPLLFLATFIWMPESPYYLLMKGRSEDARKSLKKLRRMKNVDEELSQLTTAVKRQTSESGKLQDLFLIRSNLKACSIIFGLRTFQQLSGVSVINFYLQVIFKEAGSALKPEESAIITSAVLFLAMCAGLKIVDKFGRKFIFLTASIGTAIILILMGVYFTFKLNGHDMSSVTWFPIAGMMIYSVTSSGFLMIPNLMAGELLSVSIKPMALGIINVYLGIFVSATSKMFHWMNEDFGMNVPFYFLGICCIASVVFCYFCVPETKGKSLEEIQLFLKSSDIPATKKTENNELKNASVYTINS